LRRLLAEIAFFEQIDVEIPFPLAQRAAHTGASMGICKGLLEGLTGACKSPELRIL
jgi:hypothetical protein